MTTENTTGVTPGQVTGADVIELNETLGRLILKGAQLGDVEYVALREEQDTTLTVTYKSDGNLCDLYGVTLLNVLALIHKHRND